MTTKRRVEDVAGQLRVMDACIPAVEWVESLGPVSWPEAWRRCDRGDWLLWLCAQVEIDRHLLVRASCACARTALPCVPAGEMRPLRAIEAAEAWARGEASIDDARAAAARAAAAAAAAAAASAADDAANAAAYAANAAAYAAARAAYAAARAAGAPAYATRSRALREMADLVRGVIQWRTVRAAMRRRA